MATKGPGPAPLDPKVVRRLLDLLSSDDGFRERFQHDPRAALVEAGYEAPPATSGERTMAPVGDECGMLMVGDRLAPKEQIRADRERIESALVLPFTFLCTALQSD